MHDFLTNTQSYKCRVIIMDGFDELGMRKNLIQELDFHLMQRVRLIVSSRSTYLSKQDYESFFTDFADNRDISAQILFIKPLD